MIGTSRSEYTRTTYKDLYNLSKKSNSLSPKGYVFYTNLSKDDSVTSIFTASYYKTIRKAARDCHRPLGLAICKKSYRPDTLVNKPSLHVLESDIRRLNKINDILHEKFEPVFDEQYSKGIIEFYLPIEVVIPIVRKAVFEAVRLGIF